MNTQPKSKVLLLIIGILLLANIATLSFFLLNKCSHSKTGKQDRVDMVAAYLKREVGFNEAQLAKYDTLSKIHRSEMKPAYDSIASKREMVLKQLGANQFMDSSMNTAAAGIAAQQQSFETRMFNHLKDIRAICTPAQKLIFDTGFYKIISRRGEGRKNKN